MADFVNKIPELKRNVDKAIEESLRLVGGQAERFAKEEITEMKAVDTGFLRNSITWALDGEEPEIGEYTDDSGEKKGEYSGTMPSEKNGRAVYVGTNVYYAPYIEYGTTKMDARPFLSQSVSTHQDDFKELFKEAFSHFS